MRTGVSRMTMVGASSMRTGDRRVHIVMSTTVMVSTSNTSIMVSASHASVVVGIISSHSVGTSGGVLGLWVQDIFDLVLDLVNDVGHDD